MCVVVKVRAGASGRWLLAIGWRSNVAMAWRPSIPSALSRCVGSTTQVAQRRLRLQLRAMVRVTAKASAGTKRKGVFGRALVGSKVSKTKHDINKRAEDTAELDEQICEVMCPAPPSTSASSAPSTPGPQVIQLVCLKCDDPTTLRESQPSGSQGVSRICNVCNTTKASWTTKMKSNPALKLWWGKLGDAEQKDFYKRQKVAHSRPGARRTWDLHQFETFQEKKQGEEGRARMHWEPMNIWRRGEVLDDPSLLSMRGAEREKILNERWAALMADANVGKKMINGVWCVAKFAGFMEDQVTSDMTGSKLARSSKVDDHAKAAEMQKEAADFAHLVQVGGEQRMRMMAGDAMTRGNVDKASLGEGALLVLARHVFLAIRPVTPS